MEIPELITLILALGTVFGQVFLAVLGILWLYQTKIKKQHFTHALWLWLKERSLAVGFFVAGASVVGSLLLSEVANYPPCLLCWIQRALMYPQAIILGIAFFKKKYHWYKPILILSSIGAIIATYHYVIQIDPNTPSICTSIANSCTSSPFFYFGYISIPIMSITAFVLLLIITKAMHAKSKENKR